MWFDALCNYLTVAEHLTTHHTSVWPHAVHLVGKDILRYPGGINHSNYCLVQISCSLLASISNGC